MASLRATRSRELGTFDDRIATRCAFKPSAAHDPGGRSDGLPAGLEQAHSERGDEKQRTPSEAREGLQGPAWSFDDLLFHELRDAALFIPARDFS